LNIFIRRVYGILHPILSWLFGDYGVQKTKFACEILTDQSIFESSLNYTTCVANNRLSDHESRSK